MKEIGKLIELLNEYEGQDTWSYDEEMGMPYYGWGDDCDYEVYLISKKYGFIGWLVDNDKIEFREDFYLEDQHGGGFGEDENIIMLLAIQDNPIEFLCSVLK